MLYYLYIISVKIQLYPDSKINSRDGGIGRRNGLKIRRSQEYGGSSPPLGTNFLFNIFLFNIA